MIGRKPKQKEKEYISKMYKTSQVSGLYVLNFFIILTVLLMGAICLFVENNGGVKVGISKLTSQILFLCLFLLVIFARGNIVMRNKTAVKAGKYEIVEGMAVQYIPYKISDSGAYKVSNGQRTVKTYNAIIDGKIIFRSNIESQITDWIDLKYKSCPKGKNLGEFPVLLIRLQNGIEFAVTDWDKIRNNPQYAHIKPFMVSNLKSV